MKITQMINAPNVHTERSRIQKKQQIFVARVMFSCENVCIQKSNFIALIKQFVFVFFCYATDGEVVLNEHIMCRFLLCNIKLVRLKIKLML